MSKGVATNYWLFCRKIMGLPLSSLRLCSSV